MNPTAVTHTLTTVDRETVGFKHLETAAGSSENLQEKFGQESRIEGMSKTTNHFSQFNGKHLNFGFLSVRNKPLSRSRNTLSYIMHYVIIVMI